jgi:molybdate transport system ATP-binding protein
LRGQVIGVDERWQLLEVDCAGAKLWLSAGAQVVGSALRLRVEARDVSLSLDRPERSSVQNLIRCRIDSIAPARQPAQCLVRLVWGDQSLWSRITARAVDALSLAPGAEVWAQVKAVAVLD